MAQYYEENLADDEEKENLKRNGEKSKLLRESEQTKIELSKNDVAYLRGKEIKREDFEKWCQDLLERAIEPVKKIFEEGNRIIDPDQVKRVVLAGGSSKIPKIREQLQEFFGPDVELYDIDEGCSVSVGAAMQGAIMKGEIKTDELEGAELKDTLPLSLGISQANGVNSIIIPHGTVLPAKYTTMATTSVDGQTNVAFDIVQGERKMAKDCIKLGHVTVHGIQVAKRCVPKIEVVMEIDESGFLAVHATDLATGATMTTSVYSQSNLSENDIQSLLDDAERNQAEDDLKCLVASEKAELSYSINKFDRILKENPLAQSQNNEARKKIDAARNWLKQNEESNDVETITAKRVELEQLFDKIYPE
ncbi:hypothetical protein TRFO_05911 [Tritrichomonas foetus]|uniref:Uncharacterized protein n=1 Tax=Tritrichomonas foetus TaxID=1144522 RepID=A0A1J4K1M5_9EUKA|nr:hypothetical protein TRFO_05911 [Tritrichomonas foetus]|eukprot:OHT05337.1 hypothetical protein TRFO_05911 [Tritrichomonas foetus]